MCDNNVVYQPILSMAHERYSINPNAEPFSVPTTFQTSFPSDRPFNGTNDTPRVLDASYSGSRTGGAVISDHSGIRNFICRSPASVVDHVPLHEPGVPDALAIWAEMCMYQPVTGQHLPFIAPVLPRIELPKIEASYDQLQLSPYPSPSPITPEVSDVSLGSFSEAPLKDVGQSNSQECYNLWKQITIDAIVVTGTHEFVPQSLYKPFTEADKERYLERVVLSPPIIFMTKEPFEWGVSLEDALKGRLRHLVDNGDPVLQDCGPSVSIRINWPGYPSFKRQIPSRNWSKMKNPITKGKLAQNVAKTTARFIEKMSNKPLEMGAERRWKLGPQYIKLGDLILVSLHHYLRNLKRACLEFVQNAINDYTILLARGPMSSNQWKLP